MSILKQALILNRRTFNNVENRNARDSIFPFKKQGNRSNANRSTQAVSDQLFRVSSMQLAQARQDWEAYQKRGRCSGIREHGRQKAHAVVDQGCYIEVRINIGRLGFRSRDSLPYERVMAPWESAAIKRLRLRTVSPHVKC